MYNFVREGNHSPPFFGGKKRGVGLADRARPDHFLRNRVAMGWISFSRNEIEKLLMRKCQERTPRVVGIAIAVVRG